MDRREYLRAFGVSGLTIGLAGCNSEEEPPGTEGSSTQSATATTGQNTESQSETDTPPSLRVRSVDAPGTISVEEPFEILVIVENPGETVREATVSVTLDAEELTKTEQRVDGEEEQVVRIPLALPDATPTGDVSLTVGVDDEAMKTTITVEQAPTAGEWWTENRDFANTGVGQNVRGPLTSPNSEWTLTTGSRVWAQAGPNQVYATSSNGRVKALSPATGERVWEQSIAGETNKPPAVGDGTLFVGHSPLYGIDTSQGDILWQNDSVFALTPILYHEGKVFIGNGTGHITALDAETGSVEWEYPIGFPSLNIGTVADGTLYMGDQDNILYALDVETGEEQWQTGLEGPGLGVGTPVVDDGTVYVGNDGAHLYAFDAATGDLEWSRKGPIVAIINGLQIDDERIYAAGRNPRVDTEDGTLGGDIAAFNRSDGSLVWRHQIQHDIHATPVLHDSRLHVAHDGGVTTYRAPDGERLWNRSLPNRVRSASRNDKQLVLGCWNGRIYSFNLSDGNRNWESQRLPGGPANASPAVAEGMAVLGSTDGNFYAADADTGEQQWRFETEEWVFTTATIQDGVAYCCSAKVFALDLEDANVRWYDRIMGGIANAPVVVGDSVLVAARDFGIVRSYQCETGEVNWSKQFSGTIPGTPARYEENVILGTDQGSLYSVEVSTGAINWEERGFGSVQADPTVVDGTGFTGTAAGDLISFDATSGDVQWRETVGPSLKSSPAVTDNAVFVSADGPVAKLDRASGERLWQRDIGSNTRSSPAVDQEYVYVVSEGELVALDRERGTEHWRHSVGPSPVYSSPAVVGGRILLGDGNGNLRSIDAEL